MYEDGDVETKIPFPFAISASRSNVIISYRGLIYDGHLFSQAKDSMLFKVVHLKSKCDLRSTCSEITLCTTLMLSTG